MSQPSAPRHGSIQFWPRKRAKHPLARIHYWPSSNQAKPQGFIGYKAGMTHVIAIDNGPKSLTKNENISLPVTIIECPPMFVAGISFYKNSKKIAQINSSKKEAPLSRKIDLPKKETKKIDEVVDFDNLRLLVCTLPRLTGIGNKKPHLLEIELGGSKEDKLNYAKQKLGQELRVNEVFTSGASVDAHGITTGKGFQGTVKRFGVPIRQHKAEKTKRGIATLGSWTPKHVQFTVPQSGKMGYHLRTEYNRQIINIVDKPEEINPKSGIVNYGIVKNTSILLKGSVPGPKKRAVVLVNSIRPNKKIIKEAPEVIYLHK